MTILLKTIFYQVASYLFHSKLINLSDDHLTTPNMHTFQITQGCKSMSIKWVSYVPFYYKLTWRDMKHVRVNFHVVFIQCFLCRLSSFMGISLRVNIFLINIVQIDSLFLLFIKILIPIYFLWFCVYWKFISNELSCKNKRKFIISYVKNISHLKNISFLFELIV